MLSVAAITERVDRLEETLNRLIEQTNAMLKANREDIAEIRASNARTDRMLLAMWQQADKDREQADKDREQAKLERLEAAKERKEFNRQLAGISDRLGSLIEDMVAPNAPRIARQLFEGDDVLTSSIRIRRRHPSDSGRTIEFDLIVASKGHVLVVEAKSKVTAEKIVAFLGKVRLLPEFFPEFTGFTVLPMIASVNIEPSLVTHMSRLRVYALGFGDETMEVLNKDDF